MIYIKDADCNSHVASYVANNYCIAIICIYLHDLCVYMCICLCMYVYAFVSVRVCIVESSSSFGVHNLLDVLSYIRT